MFGFLKKKPKELIGCLGYYDVKLYHSLETNLIYAKDVLIEKNPKYCIYARVFHKTMLVFTLVEDEEDFDLNNFNFTALKSRIVAQITDEFNSTVNIIIFHKKNAITTKIAKEILVNNKKEFNQILVYNGEKVRLEFYRPVPNFYHLYESYAEAIYFDIAAFDPTR